MRFAHQYLQPPEFMLLTGRSSDAAATMAHTKSAIARMPCEHTPAMMLLPVFSLATQEVLPRLRDVSACGGVCFACAQRPRPTTTWNERVRVCVYCVDNGCVCVSVGFKTSFGLCGLVTVFVSHATKRTAHIETLPIMYLIVIFYNEKHGSHTLLIHR